MAVADGVSLIDRFAFARCENLASINISDSVILIDSFAFQECKSLASINLPDSVTAVSKDAFTECKNLANITYNGKTYSRSNAGEMYNVLPCFKENMTFDEFKRAIFS